MKTGIRKIVYTALLAALICALAPLSFPVGPIPITLGTFAIYISSSAINKKYGLAAVAVYILLGAFGVPVFSGFTGGIQKLVGITGGYIIGYLPMALIIGILCDKFPDKKYIYPLSYIIGTIALYLFGTAWYIIQTKASVAGAVGACVLPFLPGDLIKTAVASVCSFKLRAILKNKI